MELKEAKTAGPGGSSTEQHGAARSSSTHCTPEGTYKACLPAWPSSCGHLQGGNTRGENGEKTERPACPGEAESFPSTQNALARCYQCPTAPCPKGRLTAHLCCQPWKKTHCMCKPAANSGAIILSAISWHVQDSTVIVLRPLVTSG